MIKKKIYFYDNMKTNKVLTNFKDISKYIIFLPFEEQMYEINKIIKYLVNFKYPRLSINHKFTLISDIKKFKEDLIRFHLQELKDNPKLAINNKSLHKLLNVQ